MIEPAPDPPQCLCGHSLAVHLKGATLGCEGAGYERGVRLCRCEGFVEAWASGYLIEFTDEGAPERYVVRISDEKAATRTARALEQLGALPYNGSRPVLYGTVFTCTQASLGGAGLVSALWADGPKAAIERLTRKEDEDDYVVE